VVDQHSWPIVLRTLSASQDLPSPVAAWAMEQILTGQASPAQIAAFAMGLRVKGESAGEIAGIVPVMLQHAHMVPLPDDLLRLDVVGTGGDMSHSVNISTMAALVCAAAGVPVAKHGNRAASSSTGTADVLEELGVRIDLSPEQVARTIKELGVGFCMAPLHHPALRHAAPVRKELGVPTFFNILGPLANPAGAQVALVGCADARLAPVVADVLAARGVCSLVVRGQDGLDEISTSGPTQVWDARSPSVTPAIITPEQFGIAQVPVQALVGGDRVRNAALLRQALSGQPGDRVDASKVSAIQDAVTLNAAAALACYSSALSGAVPSLVEAIGDELSRARQVVDSGAAWALLEQWVHLTAALSAGAR